MRGPTPALIGAFAILVVMAAPTDPVAAQVGVPVPPESPEATAAPDARRCICVDELARGPHRIAFSMGRRARLGVMLGEPTEVAGRHGVRLREVPEGSPARRAGLQQGDVIVGVNGAALDEPAPADLAERLRAIDPGDTVTVSFFRSGQEQTARVVTEANERFRAFAPAAGRDAFTLPRGVARGLGALRSAAGLELAAVNPELGEYFGTERGVLVTAVDADSPLGLRPGDVILAIGGREVQDPAHVRSMLASYRQNETITLRIVRENRTREITGRRS